jgi:quercetin dioxygenase-like cupin family protein
MHKYLENPKRISFIAAADLLERTNDLPKADTPGFERAIGRGFRTPNTSVGIGVILGGQRSPLHSSSADHLLLGLTGEIIFRSDGTEYRLGPGDLIFLGAEVFYEYWNPGRDEARFVDVLGRSGEGAWPASGKYPDAGR